jgi:hypothetical protein
LQAASATGLMTAGEAGRLFLSPYNFVLGASIAHPSFALKE